MDLNKEFIASSNSANFCVSERESDATSAKPTSSEINTFIKKNQPWEFVQGKFLHMKQENERLTKELLGERDRALKYQKQLKYLKENHVVFEKLKDAYMHMKYNEASSRKSTIEISEKSSQYDVSLNVDSPEFLIQKTLGTDDNLPFLIQTGDEIFVEPEYIPVKKAIFEGLKQNIQTLKEMILSQPLSTFVLSEQREAKYRKDIAVLFQENRSLKQIVINKQLETEELRKHLEPKNIIFKKIIAKLALRIPDLYSKPRTKENLNTELNDKELKVVAQIAKKFEAKIKQKVICTSISTDTVDITPPSPYFTPPTSRTPIATERSNYFISKTSRSDIDADENITMDK